MTRRSLAALLGCLLVGLAASHALADGEVTVHVLSADDSAFPQVRAVFTADEAGRPLAGLGVANIKVEDQDSPATVQSVAVANDARIPLALVIAFDTSGSMAGANLQQSQSAAKQLLASLAPGDSAGLVTFADDVHTAVPLTNSPASLLPAIDGLTANGNTALYDAVGEASRVTAGSGVLRRAVVLFSDGEDAGGRSRLSRAQSLQGAADGQAIFYVIGIGQLIDRGYLDELATRSGGRLFAVDNASALPTIYAAIAESLRSQYVVTFQSSAPSAGASRSVRLSVTTASGSGTGALDYASQRAAPTATSAAEPTQAPTALPGAATGETTRKAHRSEGTSSAVVALLVLLLLAGAGLPLFLLRRRNRRRDGPQDSGRGHPSVEVPRPEPLAAAVQQGTIRAFSGETLAGMLAINGSPVTVGSSPGCDLVLGDDGGSIGVLRLWMRDGRPMAHVLVPGPVTLNGSAFEWASIKDSDELRLGPFELQIQPETHVAGAPTA